MILVGMDEKQFNKWKRKWFDEVPKCRSFVCCHELTSCAIRPLCGCGSIYETYRQQTNPEECLTVTCEDCIKKYTCNRYKRENYD